ncbi:helix-turn-helix transcriptional regulator [Streptomyces sp. NPDC006186]|uniref:helix-turn-helix domain-containing protein n=1 Tax=Streptomyces sp. NPDC006186 TaxID=3155248 RepID=UPI0033B1AE3B
MVEQPEFGRRLREIRSARGLSQSDVAGKGLSPSYISLVESGNRTPSPKAVRAIAERLGVTVDDLTAPAPQERQRVHRVEVVGRLIAARSLQAAGDLARAREELLDVVRQAGDSGLDEIRWEAGWELALVLGRLGRDEEREEALRSLLADPLTGSSPLLRARVAVETADMLRRTGRLSESVRLAEEALEGVPADAAERVQAQISLLSGRLESGEWERAAGLCEELLASAETLPPGQLRATALWVAAEHRFAMGDTEQALTLVDRAVSLTGPDAGTGTRVRMLWAAALLHLAAGRDDTADALTERTGQTVTVLGTPADAARLAMLRTLTAYRRGDVEDALEQARTAAATDAELPPLDRARCALAGARAQRAAGHRSAAEAGYRTAAALYETAGAFRSAAAVWRELSVPDGAPSGAADPLAVVTP